MDIKDSGNRTEFNTGAVRDLHEGKGRYDLIPWDAIHELAIHDKSHLGRESDWQMETHR